ncbi:MAG: cupin [Calothrix sp. C42_A2020_038]|nr:cupin [Calothrix sp. C42_A2020_038]
MKNRDWFVSGDGQYTACKSPREWDLLRDNYRLYRFLTEVEDILSSVEDESSCLPEMRMLVRRLITNSYWVHQAPVSESGTSVLLLYDELGFPLTVQTVTFAPGIKSNIHNHGTWGIVAILQGQEKNTFWKRTQSLDGNVQVEQTGELILFPGDIISFNSDAIHCVEAMGDTPTVTFNIYGETDPKRRYEFDPVKQVAKRF